MCVCVCVCILQVAVCISIFNQWKAKAIKNKNRSIGNVGGGSGVGYRGMVEEEDEEDKTCALEVGHNIYILAYKLSEHKPDLKEKLESESSVEAIKHYAERTAQIEVGEF